MRPFDAERRLARLFFARLFESDLMPPGLPQVQIIIWGLALFAGPSYLLSWRYALRYGTLDRAALAETLLPDRLLLVTVSLMCLGLVALIVWEGVFPDRRDARILGPLPLAVRTHVIARLAAVAAVAALFVVGVNLPTAVIYGLALWGNHAVSNPLRAIGGHFVSTASAGAFMFFSIVACQGALLNVFGRRTAGRLALVLQVVLVVALLQAILFVPYLAALIRNDASADGWTPAAFLPPAWFLALYDAIAATPRPLPTTGAYLAALGASVATLAAVALLAGSYHRLVRMALETPTDVPRGGWMTARMRSAVARIVPRHPVSRAFAGFTLRTLGRSRMHLMLLATYVGLAIALVLATLIPFVARQGAAALAAPGVAVLSAPLIVYFVMLCGLRVLFTIPVEIKANWLFRLYAPENCIAAGVAGVRAALLVAVVVPVALAAGLAGAALWGEWRGVLHALITATFGVLLADVLLIGFRKVPFTARYYPGRSRTRTIWPAYPIAFAAYAYGLASLEQSVLGTPAAVTALLGCAALAMAALAYLRRRTLQAPPGLVFEEDDPEVPFDGLKLSERLAAESRPTPVLKRIDPRAPASFRPGHPT